MEKDFDDLKLEERDDSLNIRELVRRYFARWPIFLISAFLALGISMIYLKYQQPVYQVKTKVLIKESSGATDPSSVLFGNRLMRRLSDIPNQSTIIKSYPIVYKAIERAGLNVKYFKTGAFGDSELYRSSPFKVLFKDSIKKSSKALSQRFLVTIQDDKTFDLRCESLEDFNGGNYPFDTWFDLAGLQMKLQPQNVHKEWSKDDEYGFLVSTTEQLARQYKNKILVEESKLSTIVDISFRSNNTLKAKGFLNTLLEVYIEENLAQKNMVADSTVRFIDRELLAITDSLYQRENQLEEFQSSLKVPNLTMQGEMILEEFTQLEVEKDEFELKEKYYTYIKETLSEEQSYDDILTPAAFGINDPVLNEMILNLIGLQLEMNTLIQRGAEKSARIGEIEGQMADFKKIIAKSIDDLSKSNSIVLKDLESKLSGVKESAKRLPKSEREYVNLKRLLNLNEGIYIFLMEKRANALITKSANSPDCRIIEPPLVEPSRPIAPDSRMTKIVGFLLGLFIPLALMIAVDSLNDKIKTREELEGLTTVPVLGAVPHSNKLEEGILVAQFPKSSLAESMRMIRSNLDFFGEGKGGKVILITSSISGEGKTFMAINLGGIMAMSGMKTVVVGLDLRKPKLHEYLDISNGKGVSTYLSGACDLSDVILPNSTDNLHIIPSGPVPPNPAELLLNKRAIELIDELKNEYDYVILDTAPNSLVTDAQVLMKHSDVNVFIVRRGKSTRGFVKTINATYHSGKFKNLSVIVNDVKPNKSYGYGYGYYDETSSPGRFGRLLRKFGKV